MNSDFVIWDSLKKNTEKEANLIGCSPNVLNASLVGGIESIDLAFFVNSQRLPKSLIDHTITQ